MSKKVNLREAKEKASTPVQEEAAKLTAREIEFGIEYDSPEGDVKKTKIRSKVLDGDGRLVKMRLMAQLAGGVSVDTIGAEERYRLDVLSKCVAQIQDPAQWVLDAMSEDNEFLIEVHKVLMEHENRYFRRDDGAGDPDKRKPRISIDSSALT